MSASGIKDSIDDAVSSKSTFWRWRAFPTAEAIEMI